MHEMLMASGELKPADSQFVQQRHGGAGPLADISWQCCSQP